jgi:hypothetical protein
MTSRPAGSSAISNTLRLAILTAGVIVLAGCAVAVPLRPEAMASHDSRSRDSSCTANLKCSNTLTLHRRTSRGPQPAAGGNIADDPPDFILNNEGGMQP